MAFALADSIINDFSLDVLQSFTPDLQWLPCHSPASGPLASPHESEHVGAHECASPRAQMMRQCIYISLVKQERWHVASTEAQSLEPEHLVGLRYRQAWSGLPSNTLHTQAGRQTGTRSDHKVR